MRSAPVASSLALLLAACNPPPGPAAPASASAPLAPPGPASTGAPSVAVTSVTSAVPAPIDPTRLAQTFDARLREVGAKDAGGARALTRAAREQLDAFCASQGGVTQLNHITQRLYCTPRMKDAGKACRAGKDCDGYCRAAADAKRGDRAGGTCSEEKELDGCANVVGADGVVLARCVN